MEILGILNIPAFWAHVDTQRRWWERSSIQDTCVVRPLRRHTDGDDGDQSPAIFNRQTPKLSLALFLFPSLITSFSVTSILFHIASVGAGFCYIFLRFIMPDALIAVYGMYSHTGMQYKWKLLISFQTWAGKQKTYSLEWGHVVSTCR